MLERGYLAINKQYFSIITPHVVMYDLSSKVGYNSASRVHPSFLVWLNDANICPLFDSVAWKRETTPLKGLLIPIEFFVCRSDKQMIWLGKCTPTSDLAKCVTYVIATLAKVKKRKNADSKPFRLLVLCIFPLQQGIHFYNKNLEFVLFTLCSTVWTIFTSPWVFRALK